VTLPVAVVEAEVSTMNFQIDELSDLLVRTIGKPSVGVFEDLFDDASGISASSSISVSKGEVTLSGAPGSYSGNGEVSSVSVAPASFASWGTAVFVARIPSNTTALLRVYDTTSSTAPSLISDTNLPGNSAGFAPGSVDLSSLSTTTYQSLQLSAELSTSDAATTSALLEWSLSYTVTEPPIAYVPFSLQSSKIVGTDVSAQPIYKYENSFVTDSRGEKSIEDLEWDIYEVTIDDASYDVAEACERIPYALDPGVQDTLVLTLVPASAHSLRVRVQDTNGDALANAEVTLSRSGFSDTEVSSTCGGAFFNDAVSSAVDYTLFVEATGYADNTTTDIAIDGSDALTITMTSL
jgi:hypothetical protein